MSSADQPSLTAIGQLRVHVAPPVELGLSPLGRRRMIAILGGEMDGEIGTGTVLPGGADWQTVHDDGSVTITAEYTIQFTEGDVMTLRSIGVRAFRDGTDSPPHFRTSIVFAAESHRAAVNHNLYVSTGSREGNTVTLNLFRVD
jgi:Protein of unknown function (DUF3237)